MDRWTEFEFFVHVVELGSLSKAAEMLGLSNPTASRQLTSLERRLGARLIERSTRRMFVTEVGLTFYERCKAALDAMKDAVSEVSTLTSSPAGVLRVTASISLLLEHVAPLVPEFSRRYPDLRLNLIAANRYYDVLDNNVDVAIRTREYEPDSTLVIRRLASARPVLAASPAYLDKYGMPATPLDLATHRLLVYTYNYRDELTLQRGAEVIKIRPSAFLEANDGQVLRAVACRDMGILLQPVYVIYDDLVTGRLVPLLQDWDLPNVSINVAYPHRSLIPAKTRVFIDFLTEAFQLKGYEQRWDSVLPKRSG